MPRNCLKEDIREGIEEGIREDIKSTCAEGRIMMTLEEMKKQKQKLGYTNRKIAEETGIPLGTVQKIFAGVTKSPRWDKMQALEKLLKPDEAPLCYSRSCRDSENKNMPSGVRERLTYEWREPDDRDPSRGTDPKQGHYTVEDYLAIPDERRVELIDGFLYDMAAPSLLHQAVLIELAMQFYTCMENHPDCAMMVAPLDVQLGKNRKTVVQPDLLIICNRKDHDIDMLRVPPDFIIEIVSPSNPENDKFRKLNKYRFAGVREYWIVDPQSMKITVYRLEHDMDPEIYGFTDSVPVGISGGSCTIDFRRISNRVEKYL